MQKATSRQGEGNLEYWGIVGKANYSISFFDNFLTVSPQLKYRWELGTYDPESWSLFGDKSAATDTSRHAAWWMPILRIDLQPTPNTYIRFGFQGFTSHSFREYGGEDDTSKPPKGIHLGDIFSYQYRNGVLPERSFNERIFMVMITNASEYSGYKLQFIAGFQYIHQNYLDADLRDPNYSRVFVRVLAGW